MIEAIKVALRFSPAPNPRVGAVLVDKNNKIKKIAAHQNQGYDHAEYSLFKNSEVSPDDHLSLFHILILPLALFQLM